MAEQILTIPGAISRRFLFSAAVALPVAVSNAAPEILRETSLHLARAGGHGAVREFAEMLLKARGEWDAMVERYVGERSVTGPLTSEATGR